MITIIIVIALLVVAYLVGFARGESGMYNAMMTVEKARNEDHRLMRITEVDREEISRILDEK